MPTVILHRLGPSSQFAYRLCLLPRPWSVFLSLPFVLDSPPQGFPDRGLFGRMNKTTGTPLYSVWIVVLLSFLPGLLDLASPIAANAIFSLTAIGKCIYYVTLVSDLRGKRVSSRLVLHYSVSSYLLGLIAMFQMVMS